MGGKGPMADKGRKNGPMRLDRFLAEMGYGTRTQVTVSYTHLTLPTN